MGRDAVVADAEPPAAAALPRMAELFAGRPLLRLQVPPRSRPPILRRALLSIDPGAIRFGQ